MRVIVCVKTMQNATAIRLSDGKAEKASMNITAFEEQLDAVNTELNNLAPMMQRVRELNAMKQFLERQLQGHHKPTETLPYAGKTKVGKRPPKPTEAVLKFSQLTPDQQAELLKRLK